MQRKRGCAGGCKPGASDSAAFEGGGLGREENLRGLYWAVELLREPQPHICRLRQMWGTFCLPGSFTRLERGGVGSGCSCRSEEAEGAEERG